MQDAFFILGLNGGGKSTYRDLLGLDNVVIVDPDKIRKELNCSQLEAGKRAIKLFKHCIEQKNLF